MRHTLNLIETDRKDESQDKTAKGKAIRAGTGIQWVRVQGFTIEVRLFEVLRSEILTILCKLQVQWQLD